MINESDKDALLTNARNVAQMVTTFRVNFGKSLAGVVESIRPLLAQINEKASKDYNRDAFFQALKDVLIHTSKEESLQANLKSLIEIIESPDPQIQQLEDIKKSLESDDGALKDYDELNRQIEAVSKMIVSGSSFTSGEKTQVTGFLSSLSIYFLKYRSSYVSERQSIKNAIFKLIDDTKAMLQTP